MEINHTFDDSFLLEGYLYEKNGNMSFLLTDILLKNNEPINADYAFRYALLEQLVFCRSLKNMNNHMTIGLHPIFRSETDSIIDVFRNNFMFKESLNCTEYINGFIKSRQVNNIPTKSQEQKIIIQDNKFQDVYRVYNIDTGNEEGILYVRGIKESKALKNIAKDSCVCLCSFNKTFSKWQPILS
jgi:hypothetical protein